MSYDGAFRSFAFYSEDYDLIGKRLFFLQAFLTDYPTTVSAVEEAFIEILNPCINPNLVLGTPQMTLQPYLYSGDSEKVQFTLSPFKVDPPTCNITYSCEIVSGPRLDLCNLRDGATEASFDPSTGNYSFKSGDIANYPAGSY